MGSKAKMLLRPAPTRFCGYSYMLGRLGDVEPTLRRTVASQKYLAHKFDQLEGGDPAEELVPSAAFWKANRATTALTLPVVKKLRFFDTDAPTNSKVYKTLFSLTKGFASIEGPPQEWKKVAGDLSEERWEYAHSAFHAAGYALDPEYWEELQQEGLEEEGLEAVKEGLETVVERIALREELKERRSNSNLHPGPALTRGCDARVPLPDPHSLPVPAASARPPLSLPVCRSGSLSCCALSRRFQQSSW